MLVSSGAVAFGIVSLLPVELILQVGSGAGFAMVFALLAAAIVWNLGTWWFGLALVQLATRLLHRIGSSAWASLNQLMAAHGFRRRAEVDWAQAGNVGKSLLLSPLVGFSCRGDAPPRLQEDHPRQAPLRCPRGDGGLRPFGSGACSCSRAPASSFAHGSNDGQKGMGLIMLILIGTVPPAYALNPCPPPASYTQDFVAVSAQAADSLGRYTTSSS